MTDEVRGPAAYANRVSGGFKRYAAEILAENERLRALLASLQAERTTLMERLATVAALEAQLADQRQQLRSGADERARLATELDHAQGALGELERSAARLRRDLTTIDSENQRYTDRFVALERRNAYLANLYVASYRLHESLATDDVVSAIHEVLANLVGCEEMALYEVRQGSDTLALVSARGVTAEAAQGAMLLDDGPIARAARTGEIFLSSATGMEGPTACVPLALGDRVVGVLALFHLLPQKQGLEEVDHEIFELLATHAATALYCARLHSGPTKGGARGC